MLQGRYYFVGATVLCAFSLYLFLHRSPPASDHPAPPFSIIQQVDSRVYNDHQNHETGVSNRTSFSAALLSHAGPEKLIYLASVDSSYLPMAINLYETSFKRMAIRNYLFACSDTDAHSALQAHGINSFDFLHDKDSKSPSAFGTKAFRRKTHMKTRIVLDALLLGITVIIVDVDIVFFKDPLPYLGCTDCDIQIQSDILEGNSGFYMARPTPGSVELHRKAWAIAEKKGETVSNQKALDRNMESMSKKKQLKMKTLSLELFPPGEVYFERKKRMFYTDNPPKEEVLVHNNWIVSKAAKIYRFKEQLLWMVDTAGYYSDPTRKYLTYGNIDGSGSRTATNTQSETEALKTALLIGHLLNRTLILPTFGCANCKYSACKVATKKCSFNTHYKIATFDASYEHRYREHVFLHHPLVPRNTSAAGDSGAVYLIPGAKSNWQVDAEIQVRSPKHADGPTEMEILEWFSEIQSPVLRFHSLYKIYANFKDKSFVRDGAFNTKTDYRNY